MGDFFGVTLCRWCSPDLDPFAIGRSQTTGVNWALYRHEGPNGPKAVPSLHPGPFSKRTTIKPAARFADSAQHPKSKPQVRKDLHVYSAPNREEP